MDVPCRVAAALLAAMVLASCGGDNTESKVDVPGAQPAAKTRALEAGTAVLQAKAPIGALNIYVDGFHFVNGKLDEQMEAHHYCSVVNEDVKQCVIFDGNGDDAKLMGIEYIVSRRIFERLPEQERKLWHSHDYEVKSGTLIAPGVPEAAEHEFMEQMVGTYGKTWHTWHTDHAMTLPLGHPVLMAGFTADGQLDPQLLSERDERFGISSAARREARNDIEAPPIVPGANAWEHGEVLQLMIHPMTSAQAPAQQMQKKQNGRVTSPPDPLRSRGRTAVFADLEASQPD